MALVKLRFSIAHCTSTEDKFPPSELCRNLAASRGWQSAKGATFPQVIILDLGCKCDVTQLQLLAHECKIPRRVGVYTTQFDADDMRDAEFKSQGYVAFQHNRNNAFKSGELKSVAMSVHTRYVKLALDEPHENPLNFHGQVGLHTVILSGPRVNKHQQRQPHVSAYDPDATPLDKLAADLRYDANVLGRVRELENAKMYAANAEDFETAQKLKGQIDALLPLAEHIQECEARKRQATLEEDFHLAQLLKAEIEDLRAQAIAIGGQGRVAIQASAPSPVFLTPQHLAPAGSSVRGSAVPSPISMRGQSVASAPASPQPHAPQHGYAASPQQHQQQQQHHGASTPPPPDPNSLPFDERPAKAQGGGFAGQHASTNFDEHATPGDVGATVASPQRPPAATLDPRSLNATDTLMAEKIAGFAGTQEPPEDVRRDMKDVPMFNEIMAAFGLYATCCLFSRRLQLREGATHAIVECGDAVLTSVDSNDVVAAAVMYLGTRNAGVSDKVIGVFSAAILMLHHTLEGKFHGDCTAALKRYGQPILTHLVSRIGDSHEKVRDATAAALKVMLGHPAYGLEMVSKAIVTGKHPTAPRTWLARISLARYALHRCVNPRSSLDDDGSLTFDRLLSGFFIPAIGHANPGVRERAIDLLCSLKGRVGRPRIEEFAEKQKPTLRNVIVKKLDAPEADEPDDDDPPPPAPARGPKRKPEPLISEDEDEDGAAAPAATSPKRVVRRKAPPKPAAKKMKPAPSRWQDADEEEDDDGGGGHSGGHGSRVQSGAITPAGGPARYADDTDEDMGGDPEPQRRQPPPRVPGQCQFCGEADPAFEDHLELVEHFKRECPMMLNCPLCHNPVEVREINDHLIEDCERRSRVKRCPRCRCAVRLHAFEEHVAANKCPPYQAGTIVCPLCLTRLPDIDAMWTAHQLSPPYCSGNNRCAVE